MEFDATDILNEIQDMRPDLVEHAILKVINRKQADEIERLTALLEADDTSNVLD